MLFFFRYTYFFSSLSLLLINFVKCKRKYSPHSNKSLSYLIEEKKYSMRTNYLCIFLFVMKTNDHKLGFIKQIYICIYFSVMSDVLGNAVVVPQENNHEEAQEVPEPMEEEIDDSILDAPSSEEDSEQQRELANLCRLQEALDIVTD